MTTKYLDFTISVACGITCGINSNDDKYNSSSQTIWQAACSGRGHTGNICMLVQIVCACIVVLLRRLSGARRNVRYYLWRVSGVISVKIMRVSCANVMLRGKLCSVLLHESYGERAEEHSLQ